MLEGISAKGFVTLLIQYKLNVKQLLLLLFLYQDKAAYHGILITEGPTIANVYRFAQLVEPWTAEEIRDLVDKGLMIDKNRAVDGKSEGYPDHYEVSQDFIDAVFATSEMFEEFWEAYPSFVDNFHDPRGPKIPLKSSDYDQVEAIYKKKVRTKAKHRLVMEILAWAKVRDLINMNVAKYVGSLMFDQHLQLRASGKESSGTQHTII